MKSLKTRISELEQDRPERPPKAVYQDWDNQDLWHTEGPQKGAGIPWGQVLQNWGGYYLIQVHYVKGWQCRT